MTEFPKVDLFGHNLITLKLLVFKFAVIWNNCPENHKGNYGLGVTCDTSQKVRFNP